MHYADLCDRIELLLAGGVPEHEPHVLAVYAQLLLQEVHPDGLLVGLGEGAAAVALDHRGLAHRAVTHDHNLNNISFTVE